MDKDIALNFIFIRYGITFHKYFMHIFLIDSMGGGIVIPMDKNDIDKLFHEKLQKFYRIF